MFISTELEYVGFWARVWASLIDTILMMMVIFPILFAIYGRVEMASGVTLTGASNILISYILPAVVVIIFWTTKNATPGKMVIGATIVDAETGEPPSLKQHVIRYIGYYLSAIIFCLGFIWVGFDRKKQGWHDKLAGTVVVRKKNKGTEPVRFGI
ncbi:RDD family protein [Glaciimonas sp. Gout2]|uniref:RDD family protein n=1 Tax=unclassified Glaciimonas TaxID=2644401 RepID=UPI002B23316D|nr:MULTISPECIES: RDD family protein [unclassified Glaciimonas]MEB0011481.1 RDD family protein [Glaciimonas sp. Cout2]MEB0081485.1 RDD family protein [Glaciimonas sp. Gout2]